MFHLYQYIYQGIIATKPYAEMHRSKNDHLAPHFLVGFPNNIYQKCNQIAPGRIEYWKDKLKRKGTSHIGVDMKRFLPINLCLGSIMIYFFPPCSACHVHGLKLQTKTRDLGIWWSSSHFQVEKKNGRNNRWGNMRIRT